MTDHLGLGVGCHTIIPKLHISLVVNDPLNVWSIDHILCPMSEHVPHLSLEKDNNVGRSLIINNS
jgi:hypothetical protein